MGAGNFIVSRTADFAPDVVRVEKAAFQDFTGDGQAFVTALSRRPNITRGELDIIRSRFDETLEVGAQVDAGLRVRRNEKTLAGIAIQGVTSNITSLTSIKVARGRGAMVKPERRRAKTRSSRTRRSSGETKAPARKSSPKRSKRP